MSHIIDIQVSAEVYANDQALQKAIRKNSPSYSPQHQMRILRKSIDARQKTIKINLRIEIFEGGETIPPRYRSREFNGPKGNKSVIIVGAGPAGLFAALKLLEEGIQPILLERGKDVQARRRDLAAIHKKHIVDIDSNYCFGEGGAGTYSDGKLYTRSTKRGDVVSILETLVQFGASEDILIDAHPHIGTNKLPQIITSIREEIIRAGGKVYFNQRVTDLVIEQNKLTAVLTADGNRWVADAFILATGHSARDIFSLLNQKKISIEFKPFALGVRAEHPQRLIDNVQYHCSVRPDYLPPAAYSFVEQVHQRSVYSFCMCPGGIIAPCATSQEEVVTNGWSPSKRNNPWANSGIVVPIEWKDIPEYHSFGPLAGIVFQQHIEKLCWEAAGKSQSAPAQRIIDFIHRKASETLPECSYQPGIVSVRIDQLLPAFISETLREGFIAFGKKVKDYLSPEAIIVAPESRTSSPVRIPRNIETLEHTELKGFYPCGEGAGYAGGIISAAIDGEKVAKAIAGKTVLLTD